MKIVVTSLLVATGAVHLPFLTIRAVDPGSPPAQEASPSAGPSRAAWADIDGDGRKDAFVIDGSGGGALLLGTSDGLVRDDVLLRLPEGLVLQSASWQEVDGDGAPDLVLLTRAGEVLFLHNEGSGGFQDLTEDYGLRNAGVQGLQWVDIDQDGAMDLLLQSATGLRLFQNHRDHFAPVVMPPSEPAPRLVLGALAPSVLEEPDSETGEGGVSGPVSPASGRDPAGAERGQGSPTSTITKVFGPTRTPLLAGPASCAQTLRDVSTGKCVEADSTPTVGSLYPLTVDLNVDDANGRVGMGTTRPTATLSVDPSGADDAGHFTGNLSVGTKVLNTFNPRGTLSVDTAGAAVLTLDQADGTETVRILASEFLDNGAAIKLSDGSGIETVELDADGANGAGALLVRRGDGSAGAILEGHSVGSAGPELSMWADSGNATVRLRAEEGAGNGAELDLARADGTQTIVLDAQDGASAAQVSLFDVNGVETFEILSQETTGTGSQLRMTTGGGTTTFQIDAEAANASELSMYTTSGMETVEILSEEVAGDGAQIVLRKGDGTASIILDAEQGTTGRITTELLEITGGADLVESFDTGDEVCPPGSVLVIDAENPGELKLATEPLDHRVAGVVSGAGGVRAGLHMGQTGVASGSTPIALTGRVYVRATADNGAIRPGDLLSTSSRAGHAMRVSDPRAAAGAILGKAMGGLDEESGLVLVLVSLQ